MSDKHFDVVVLGRSLGAMATAALLGRRGFRVLALGQGAKGASYSFRQYQLRRRAFSLACSASPAFRRIMAELAQTQVIRRRLCAIDPMLCAMLPGRRFEIAPDLEAMQREIDRELPEVRRLIDELYVQLGHVNALCDAAFSRDLAWPPGSLWERHQTGAVARTLPLVKTSEAAAFLRDFPPNHPFVSFVQQSAAFASHLAQGTRALPALAVARMHGSLTRGLYGLSDGEDELYDMFAERILSLGGSILDGDRAVGIKVAQHGTHEIVLDGHLANIGANFVVSDEGGEAIAHLARGQGLQRTAQRSWPLVSAKAYRFVMSIVVRAAALPEPLGAESLVFSTSAASAPNAACPVIHLQRTDRIQKDIALNSGDSPVLLVAEAIVPGAEGGVVSNARESILELLIDQMPLMREHLLVVDSVHDGLPVWVYENGQRQTADRIELQGASRGTEPMQSQITVEPPGYLGIGGEPLRGPIPRTFLVGKTVLPALGLEGEFLSAWGAAKIITRTDRSRERMRRDMWNQVELG